MTVGNTIVLHSDPLGSLVGTLLSSPRFCRLYFQGLASVTGAAPSHWPTRYRNPCLKAGQTSVSECPMGSCWGWTSPKGWTIPLLSPSPLLPSSLAVSFWEFSRSHLHTDLHLRHLRVSFWKNVTGRFTRPDRECSPFFLTSSQIISIRNLWCSRFYQLSFV